MVWLVFEQLPSYSQNGIISTDVMAALLSSLPKQLVLNLVLWQPY